MKPKSYTTKASLRSGRRAIDDPEVEDLYQSPEQPEELLFDVEYEGVSTCDVSRKNIGEHS